MCAILESRKDVSQRCSVEKISRPKKFFFKKKVKPRPANLAEAICWQCSEYSGSIPVLQGHDQSLLEEPEALLSPITDDNLVAPRSEESASAPLPQALMISRLIIDLLNT